ncbi:MAG: IPT/TIG domain-containing protein [Acidimicrobiales bacterium]
MGLVEIIVAFAVLLLVLVPISYVLNNVISQSGMARSKVQALSIAEKWVEKLSASTVPTTPPNTPTHGVPLVGTTVTEGTLTLNGKLGTRSATVDYYPTAKYYWVIRTSPTTTTTGTPDLCTSGKVPQLLGLTVNVDYYGGNVKDTTVLDYPPAGLPKYGFLGVQVAGNPSSTTDPTPPPTRGGVPWGGVEGRVDTVPITATSVTTPTKVYSTTAGPHGCGFFELLPGKYTVHVGPESLVTPFVATGSTTATAITDPTTFTVSLSKTTATPPFLYDEGAYVNLAYPDSTVTDGSITCPNKSKFQCLVTGQGTTGSATAAVSVLSGTSWSSSDLKTTLGIEKILSSACSTVACVGVGFGASGAAAVVDPPSNVTRWTASSPTPTTTGHVKLLRQIRCPEPTACLATGTTTAGPVILGATVNTSPSLSLTWSVDNIPPTPALSSITSLTCSGTATPNRACFVVGKSKTGTTPVVLTGAQTGGAQTWAKETLQGDPTKITDLACAGGTACYVVGSSGTTPVILAGAVTPTTETWYSDTLTGIPATTSLTGVTCSGTSVCMAFGTSKAPAPVVLAAGVSVLPTATWREENLPTTMKSATVLTCAKTACLVIGSDGTGDGIYAGSVQTSPTTWVADTVPSGLTLTKLVCSTTTTCVATGTSTATQSAVMLTGTASTSKKKFTPVTFPSAATATLAGDITHDGGTSGPAPNARYVQLDSSVRPLSRTPAVHGTAALLASGPPTVTSVTPNKGKVSGGTTVTIRGTNLTTTTRVTFGSVRGTTLTIRTAGRGRIKVKDPAGTAGTSVPVVVKNNRGTSTKTHTFTYVGPPTIKNVTPAKGPLAGRTTITITGTGLTTVTSVKFGTGSATVLTTRTPGQVTVRDPSATKAGAVTVIVAAAGGTGTLATGFTYVAAPTITGVSPTQGPTNGGTLITITGTNFITVTAVRFGYNQATTLTTVTAGQVTVRDPSATRYGTVAVYVTAAGGQGRRTRGFRYLPSPSITRITPTKGPVSGGTVVKITGTHFTTVTAVKFGATTATSFTRKSATQITAVDPAVTGPVAVNVSVTTKSGGTGTKANGFTYVGAPTITKVTPSTGPSTGRTTVTISGTNFTTVTSVNFGANKATTVTLRTSAKGRIKVKDPKGTAGPVTVSVTAAGGTATLANGFTYLPSPIIDKFSPVAGPTAGGTTVTITGANFGTAISVKFGTTAARSFRVTSSTTIIAVTPAHTPASVNISVTAPGGTATSTAQFKFEVAPTLSGISPSTGPTSGGTKVTIHGNNLVDVTAIRFGTAAVATLGVRAPTTVTVKTPTHAAGKVNVYVTTGGGTAELATGFTYVAPAPTISSVNPATGTTAGGTSVAITGHDLSTASQVELGTAAATTIVVVSATRITVKTPAHAAGRVGVTVTTPSGTASKGTAFTYVTPAPTTPVYIIGVACYNSTELICVAAGATKDGAVLLVGTKPSAGQFTWQVHEPQTSTQPVKGAVVPDLPVSVSSAAISNGSFVACTGTTSTPCAEAGPLFPFTKGYSVGAGSCPAELGTAPAVVTAPGTTAATFGKSAKLPLGILAVEVVKETGKPVNGATITATVEDQSPLNSACNGLALALGTTEADGTLAVASIYERYLVTVQKGGTRKTVTINVYPTEQFLNAGAGTTTSLLPIAAVIKL